MGFMTLGMLADTAFVRSYQPAPEKEFQNGKLFDRKLDPWKRHTRTTKIISVSR